MDKRILVYSAGRTGSHELCEWISKELSIPFFAEFDDDSAESGSKIVKRDFSSVVFEDIEPLYNKKILLHRKDTLSQAESQFRADVSGMYHQPKGERLISYRLSDDVLFDNAQRIAQIKMTIDRSHESIFKSGDKGLLLSYEEIFIDGTGENKILDYIGFESKNRLYNPERRMRTEFIRSDRYLQKINFEIKKFGKKKNLI
jgi:hypothetical protein